MLIVLRLANRYIRFITLVSLLLCLFEIFHNKMSLKINSVYSERASYTPPAGINHFILFLKSINFNFWQNINLYLPYCYNLLSTSVYLSFLQATWQEMHLLVPNNFYSI